MAEIKMSYIFIEKQKHESKTMQEILLEIIDGVVQIRDDEVIKVDDIDAMHIFYTPETYEKLLDEETGLYLESSAYVYDILKEECEHGINTNITLMANRILCTVGSWSLRINFLPAKSHAYPYGNWKSRLIRIWIGC